MRKPIFMLSPFLFSIKMFIRSLDIWMWIKSGDVELSLFRLYVAKEGCFEWDL